MKLPGARIGKAHLRVVGDAHHRGVALHLQPLVVLGILEAVHHCRGQEGAGAASAV